MTVAPATPRVTLEQVASFANLVAAAGRAISGHRGTRAAQRLLFELEPTVLALQRELLAMTWRPGPFRTFTVFEPKERRIAAAPMADRVVHHALCGPLAPVFEAGAIAHSYACREQKGAHRAAALLGERLRLELKAAGTFVAPVTQGVPFVGRRIFPGTVRLAHASRSRFVRTWRRRLRQLGGGLLDAERFLRSAESLVGHLRHLDTFNLRQAVMT